jgi:hypothetical protein
MTPVLLLVLALSAIPRTRSASQPKPTMMPAMASPSPFCRPLDRLIWVRATKPKTTPRMAGRRNNPAQAQMSEAMASPLVFCGTDGR